MSQTDQIMYMDDGHSGRPDMVQPSISDHTIPLDNTLQVHDPNAPLQNVWTSDGVGEISIMPDGYNSMNISEDANIKIGDDFECTGKEFKMMMKMLLKMTKDKHPEEFI